ncbi:MAG TPA: 30S ribosomal protein S18 [Spirochaetota bacterium]|nr:30S ribosomal protein S18 [Spirochaetota bacterium]HNT09574.1 30S ribosomal protein S18 [Spirochaetota bacterium]HNV45618.1 30S ribosomal protein S18 [Spirochaetota bacterium]HOS38949.1 30S ribosomal protein S18 [Spirochaetota bacterium]HPI22550.1 30S ribosomal protein S18 [Spirochaetota bacterium]
MSDEHIAEPAQQPEAPVEATETKAPEQREARRPYREGGPRGQGGQKFKKKRCRFCFNKDIKIDYKNNELLERFITDRGKILPRRITGTCSKHQRELSTAIKRARIIALVPFIVQ